MIKSQLLVSVCFFVLYLVETNPDEPRNSQALVDLVTKSRTVLSSFAKAKTAKLGMYLVNSLPLFEPRWLFTVAGGPMLILPLPFAVRQLLDLFHDIPNTTEIQISTTKSCIDWATSERRSFLRQNLETRLVALFMAKQSYYDALTLINGLLRELKRLDDKLVLVEVQLLESRVYHALGNIAKARAALTSARTSAASVYTPPLLQANLDMQAGMLHAEDKDFNTAYSYFIEALDGYSQLDETPRATAALQYMLLCKVMLNQVDDVNQLMTSKQATKYASKSLEAMKAIARAHSNRSLDEYESVLGAYQRELGSDAFIRGHLRRLYDAMLEQNLIKVIEPFSRVEIDHVAKMVKLSPVQVEEKLSQMILDKVIIGVLDQGAGCLNIFDETHRDVAYDSALATIEKLSNVVDVLYTNQASMLE